MENICSKNVEITFWARILHQETSNICMLVIFHTFYALTSLKVKSWNWMWKWNYTCDTKQLGLVDATDSSDFAAKTVECAGKRRQEISPWRYCWAWVLHLVCLRKEWNYPYKMLWNVRIAAQLGDPPAKFYTNPIESTIIFSNSKFFHHLLTVPS